MRVHAHGMALVELLTGGTAIGDPGYERASFKTHPKQATYGWSFSCFFKGR